MESVHWKERSLRNLLEGKLMGWDPDRGTESTGSKVTDLITVHHHGEDPVERKNPRTRKKSSSPLPQCTAVWAHTPPKHSTDSLCGRCFPFDHNEDGSH